MRTHHRVIRRSAALLALALAACTEAVAPTRDLTITPKSAEISLSNALTSGIPATFANHTRDSVMVQASWCSGSGVSLERAVLTGWQPMPAAVIFCTTIAAPRPVSVAPGDSLDVWARAYGVVVGQYRMRLSTTGGEAVSGAFDVR